MRKGLRPAGLLIVAVATGSLAAACSSPSPSPPHHSTGTTATTSGGAGSTGSSTSSTGSTGSTTTGGGTAKCTTVNATAGSTQGAAGTIVGTVVVSNPGSTTCTILGYPTLLRFAAGGAPVPVKVAQGITIGLPGAASQPPSLVTLAPGQQAEFAYQYSDVPTGTETTCAASATMTVSTPGAHSPSAPFPLSMSPCDGGTVHVSPVYAGTAPI